MLTQLSWWNDSLDLSLWRVGSCRNDVESFCYGEVDSRGPGGPGGPVWGEALPLTGAFGGK